MESSDRNKLNSDYQGLNYAHLLMTEEWKLKRDKIIERDHCRCSMCYKSNSINYHGINVAIQTNDRVVMNTVKYLNIPVSTFKESIGVKELDVIKFHKNNSIGISKKGHIILVDFLKLPDSKFENTLAVQTALTRLGKSFYILSRKPQRVNSYNFSIPVITEKIVVMHVHHKYYLKNRLPWEYQDEALITLCNWCHWKVHESEIIPVYNFFNEKLINLNYTPCTRCNGAGLMPEYSHIQEGICFRCNGKKYEEKIENISPI
jgi:hypothetical protein